MKLDVKQMQRDLQVARFYDGAVDGLWGPRTQAAWDAAICGGTPATGDYSRLTAMLRQEEGEELSAYQDHLGFWTIGVGRLIDRRKGGSISPDESTYLLQNDITRVAREVGAKLPWVANLDEPRRDVLLAMAFQMGTQGLVGFHNTLELIQAGDFEDAARGMRNSLWAKQTPARAERMAEQMRTGQWA